MNTRITREKPRRPRQKRQPRYASQAIQNQPKTSTSPTARSSESIGRDLRTIADVLNRISAAYVERPREERGDVESHAAMLFGLVSALLSDNDGETLALLIRVVAPVSLRRANVIDLADWRARRGS